MADDRFVMVVSAVMEDGYSKDYGIKGELTVKQREILLAAAGKTGTADEVWMAAAIIERDIELLDEFDIHEEITEHFLKPEQVIKLTSDNWPKYPVLTSVFMRWN